MRCIFVLDSVAKNVKCTALDKVMWKGVDCSMEEPNNVILIIN